MQFRFTAEQELLRESVHSWVRSLRDNGVHRAALAGSDFGRDELWSQIVDLGWVGIAIPVELGGGGGDLVDACIVLEALAGGLAPLPFAGNAILVPAILRDNNPTLLTEVALGRRRIAPLISADFSWSERDTEMVAWDWWPGDDLLLPGDPPKLLSDEQVSGIGTVDLLRTLGQASVPGSASGLEPGAKRRLIATSRVAASTALVGLMESALESAVCHAQERHQFNRPIGSFQAVQHMCADMLVDLEAARSIAYGAAWTVANGPPDRGEFLAAAAKAWCADAARRVCELAIQIHGGMGITWEADPHLYLRAAHVWGAAFGDQRAALADVAGELFGVGTGVGSADAS